MKKTSKELLFERMHVVGGMPLKESISDNENFKSWFKNSKVVNPDGTPLVVYHGTYDSFDEFNTEYPTHPSYSYQIGSHFGNTSQANDKANEDGNVLPVYLSIQNPLEMEDMGDWGNMNNLYNDLSPKLFTYEEFIKFNNSRDVKEALIKKGYDGIFYQNKGEGDTANHNPAYIVFNPTQVKSASGNNGEFDSNNPNIIEISTP